MNKRALTRSKILRKGMECASTIGLLSVTIGVVAKSLAMSRTGVISHFSSKEDMQIEILKYTESLFVERVLKKSYSLNPLENLHSLKYNWLYWLGQMPIAEQVSCPFIKALVEYQGRSPSKIKVFMQDQQQRLLIYLTKLIDRCKNTAVFKLDTNSELFAYEFYSLYIGHMVQKSLVDLEQADQRFFIIIEQLIARHSIPSK